MALTGCQPYDRTGELTKQDYRDLLTRQPPPAAKAEEPPIPDLQPILAAPTLTMGPETRLVTVAATEDIPVKTILTELARKAEIDLDLDPTIKGGVVLFARERPLSQVIDRICDLANLRCTLKDNVLHIERDTLYTETYRLEALNVVRKSKSSIGTNTNIFEAVSGGSSTSGNSSSSSVEMTAEADFWLEVDKALKQILGTTLLTEARLAALTAPKPDELFALAGLRFL
ncbi:MAG: secretin N-terminal domain-containing protein, partial [Rhodospirillales bacterium]|nr:secretin N-terminal domain-containing protein [Rhodospirillales bacterium]